MGPKRASDSIEKAVEQSPPKRPRVGRGQRVDVPPADEAKELEAVGEGSYSSTMDSETTTHKDPTTDVNEGEEDEEDVNSGVTVIDGNTRHYFDDVLAKRLTKLAEYHNKSTGCYALSKTPLPSCDWGDGRTAGYRSDSMLCVGDKRLLLWSVGEVVYNGLVDKNGFGAPAPSICWRPLLKTEIDVAKHVIHARGEPAKDSYKDDTFWASRYVAPKGTYGPEIKLFEHVYDATEVYTSKPDMGRLSPADLRTGDIVLVEFNAKRYVKDASKTTTPNPSPNGKRAFTPRAPKRTWTTWDVAYSLEAVSLLFKGSDFYRGPDPSSEDVKF